jgi:CO/xanthine dehydrogenase FAD-binding subunit
MPLPDYIAPANLDEALVTLRQAAGDVQIIAGGTDLLPRIRAGAKNPRLLLDLRRLDLAQIRQDEDYLYLGAQLTHTQLLESELVQGQFPALAAACQVIGGPPIRNRGTLGGNLANASPAADTAPPLLVYDTDLLLVSQAGRRWLPLDDFFLGPGQTALAGDEIIKEIRLPMSPRPTAAAFLKLGQRQAMAIAVVSVAVCLTRDHNGKFAQARIALGSVAPRPIRATAAENLLPGRALKESLIAEVASVAARESSPISDIRASSEYRHRMVEIFVKRALNSAWQELQREGTHG